MKSLNEISKFLSLVLRHKPDQIGLTMDAEGWVEVDELIRNCNANRIPLNFDTLEEVVLNNDKQRFTFNEDLTKIRANQGHTVKVDLQFKPVVPPQFLYHGTIKNFLESIKQDGLLKKQRLHVHLSKDIETAIKVGSRRGKPVVLKIQAHSMYQAGYEFYFSDNGVWLCNEVPSKYICFE